ncbi:hypothetical protein SNR26_04075 [Pectobacterium brasiliense]|uniref:hypothetical protein n=1 Tax=Pectobacterium brasiliense TaxID=180957 RepID=UPI002A835179|nr:hypothetical protein [Pectobacterium brasiliense]MDY4366977.1 hypothetical protein [Pectobacterium brasiliense]MDY7056422.1 hypothetical protein [Pectobacterium brasiliense]
MLKDLHFRFTGFHGSRGRCHIRLVRADHDKPLVIICSQYINYYGTSVTNAVEIIAEKLFYDIANKRIEGNDISYPLSIYRGWDSDINFFDKLISLIFPRKYKSRFSSLRLDLVESFSKIIWIENYPETFSKFSEKKHLAIVKIDSDGYPHWFGIRDELFFKDTGLSISEILPDDDELDLNKVESKIDYSRDDIDELGNWQGYSIRRWTKKIVEQLPERLSAYRYEHSIGNEEGINELSIQDQISKFFCVELPAPELFEREFKFSKILGLNVKGKEKATDFVIYKPNREIDSLLEVKRTSFNNNLAVEIKKDIARLLLLSEKLHCYCYFLVYGNIDFLEKELLKLDKYLSLNDDISFMTKDFLINRGDFKSEYDEVIKSRGISKGYTMLQGRNINQKNGVFLWQIAFNKEMLTLHRGYEFILRNYK